MEKSVFISLAGKQKSLRDRGWRHSFGLMLPPICFFEGRSAKRERPFCNVILPVLPCKKKYRNNCGKGRPLGGLFMVCKTVWTVVYGKTLAFQTQSKLRKLAMRYAFLIKGPGKHIKGKFFPVLVLCERTNYQRDGENSPLRSGFGCDKLLS